MKYTVVSTPLADLQLTEVWLEANDRRVVTEASDRVNSLLRFDPHNLGRLRSDGRRVIVHWPLSFTFEVSEDDRKVTIVSIKYNPSTGQS
jgi:hypothetical protein